MAPTESEVSVTVKGGLWTQTAFPGIRHSETGPHGELLHWVPSCLSELCAPNWVTLTSSHQPFKSLLKLLIKTLSLNPTANLGL